MISMRMRTGGAAGLDGMLLENRPLVLVVGLLLPAADDAAETRIRKQ